MTQDLAAISSDAVRFDRPFLIHLIRDFFFVLLGVIVVELGLRFALVVYEFGDHVREEIEIAADRLASDIKSIMLNSAGPVAARTVYPILRKNYGELGLIIAVEPSEATVSSIESVFNFTPKGIPRPAEWPDGDHHEFTVELTADKFCTNCHVDVKVGGVLGRITVRNYFATHLSRWWEEVQLTGVLAMGKILLHTTILFLMLKMRMAPLLSLRSTIAALGKAGSDLSSRARIESHDEFGELAHDLNLFLDRVSRIVDELSAVLAKVGKAHDDLNRVRRQMGEGVANIEARVARVTREALEARKSHPLLSEEWLQAGETVLSLLQTLSKGRALDPEQSATLERTWDRLKESSGRAREVFDQYDRLGQLLIGVSGDLRDLSHCKEEIAALEENMQGIADLGQTLIQRLGSVHGEQGP